MNFYKHHLGDYDGHTAHLSWDEDMAYTRLMRAYYRREKAIPQAEAYRLCRAQSRVQKQAVDTVLAEFFTISDDGHHNKRCDEEITAYQAQADTNRRIAQQRIGKRIVERTDNEPSHESLHEPLDESNTIHTPNHKPDTKNQRNTQTSRGKPRLVIPLPENFAVSERVAAWAAERGCQNLDRHFENFVSVSRAKGYKYADWDEALMGAVRKDWAGIGDGKRRVAL